MDTMNGPEVVYKGNSIPTRKQLRLTMFWTGILYSSIRDSFKVVDNVKIKSDIY